MPTSADNEVVLLDTSAAVALSLEDHVHHGATARALRGRPLGLAGHAAFETFSVLTRLPAPARRPPAVVARLLSTNFPETRFLSPDAAHALLAELASGEVAGGAVYDALVGAVAREHQATLATHDRRALDTYRVLGVDVEILPTDRQSGEP
jgi:predicted nucleic acid-binding protein